jgi:hypothetical protein
VAVDLAIKTAPGDRNATIDPKGRLADARD